MDQTDQATLDQHINRNLKRNLKEADAQVSIKREITPNDFHIVCIQTYHRQGIKIPYSFELFSGIDSAVQLNGAGVKLGAFNHNNQLLAVSYLLWDRDRAYYFLAGDTNEGRSTGASILLCREALSIAFDERKVKTFDFCGSMLEPITEIRRQFGARAVPLMKIFKAKYKWLDILYALTR